MALGHLAVLEGAGLDGSGGGVNIESLGPAPLCPGLDISFRPQVLQSTTWCSWALSEQLSATLRGAQKALLSALPGYLSLP